MAAVEAVVVDHRKLFGKGDAMDLVQLSDSGRVVGGLAAMLTDRIGDNDYVYVFVDVPVSCFVVTVAKLAEDKEEWFPRGKWATIQAIETRIHEAIMKQVPQ